MEAVKALMVILLAGAVAFAAVLIYNNRTEPAYEAKIIQANKAGAVAILKEAALERGSAMSVAPAHRNNKQAKLSSRRG